MRGEAYFAEGKRWWVRLHDRAASARNVRAGVVDSAKIRDGGKAALFRSAAGHTGALIEKPMRPADAWRMVELRAVRYAGSDRRAGAWKNAQATAAVKARAQPSPYDRVGDEITFDVAERISI